MSFHLEPEFPIANFWRGFLDFFVFSVTDTTITEMQRTEMTHSKGQNAKNWKLGKTRCFKVLTAKLRFTSCYCEGGRK